MGKSTVRINVRNIMNTSRAMKAVAGGTMTVANKKAAASLVAARARQIAPEESGLLKSTIHVTSKGEAVAGKPGIRYILPIHWGWAARNIKESLFMVKAWEQVSRNVQLSFERAAKVSAKKQRLKVR